MSQIQKKFIKDQAIDETKILLLNDGSLKARNAANSADVELLKLDGSNVLKVLKLPRADSALAAPADYKDLITKEYSDALGGVLRIVPASDGLTTTLTASDGRTISVSGSFLSHTIRLPSTADLVLGASFYISNRTSAGQSSALTIQDSTGAQVLTLPQGFMVRLTVESTAAQTWMGSRAPTTVPGGPNISAGSGKIINIGNGTSTNDAAAIGQVMLRSGTQAMTGAMDLGSFKIQNVADPTAAQDAATKAFVDAEFLAKVTNQLGAADGIATLDANGKLPASQLTVSAFEYKGNWDADANTPALADGTGNQGDVYNVSVAGTHNFGAGAITFQVGDKVVYNGSVYEKWDAVDQVVSVNGEIGAVVLTAGDIDLDAAIRGQTEVQAALVELESLISALEGASVEFAQEKIVLSAGDISNGYIDLAVEAIGASINAFVDRLAIHETDDYTLSVVGGKTRITFVGNLVSPSEEQVAAGDVVRVKYAKVAI